MDFDKKDSWSYLEGVPFHVGPKFCPPRNVSMPYVLDYELPDNLLSSEYDFTLENKVLVLCRAKAEAEESLRQQQAEEEEEKNATLNETKDNVQPMNPTVAMWNPDTILQPQSELPKKSDSSKEDLPFSNSISLKQINLSDFEIDTSSPFDNMELKTINDLEVLNTVFQGLCNKERPGTQEDESSGCDHYKVPNVGNVSKSISFPLPQNYLDGKSDANPFIAKDSNAFVAPRTISKSSSGYLSNSSPTVSALGDEMTPTSQYTRSNENSDSSVPGSFAFSQVPCSATKYCTSSQVPLRSSKSIPDLSNMSNCESVVPSARSRTPPAKACEIPRLVDNGNVITSADSFNSNLSTCSRNDSAEEETIVKCVGLPDPYEELNVNEKHFVDSVTDMGFQRGQVSRTVKHLGTDEKKVIEHLCQIQVLEESGYDQLEAEAALHLHDYDKEEAIQYLELLNQFQDLGFQRDAIKKALVQNRNDRDKVIDALLS